MGILKFDEDVITFSFVICVGIYWVFLKFVDGLLEMIDGQLKLFCLWI